MILVFEGGCEIDFLYHTIVLFRFVYRGGGGRSTVILLYQVSKWKNEVQVGMNTSVIPKSQSITE
jgi:hypothetical protein